MPIAVLPEHNDLADMRRATIDLEPWSKSGHVRDVHIRNNKIGPGRLLFVAGHGVGDISDVFVTNNRPASMRRLGSGIPTRPSMSIACLRATFLFT